MRKNYSHYFSLSLFLFISLLSCGPESKKQDAVEQLVRSDSSNPTEAASSPVYTYELIDVSAENSPGKKQFGYDILMDGKKVIHQPIIPAIPGNIPFQSESDARKTAAYALQKMRMSGSLPTITIAELDSLGIQYN